MNTEAITVPAVRTNEIFFRSPVHNGQVVRSSIGVSVALVAGEALVSVTDLLGVCDYSTKTSAPSQFRTLFLRRGLTFDLYVKRISTGRYTQWFINKEGLRLLCDICSERRTKNLKAWLEAGGMEEDYTDAERFPLLESTFQRRTAGSRKASEQTTLFTESDAMNPQPQATRTAPAAADLQSTTRAPAPAPVATTATTREATAHGPDMLAVIGLHIEASQAVQRCASELTTPGLSYVEACRHVDKAAELLHALRNLQISTRACGANE